MTRFLVKASEFKNVCKAVNDRKLAELKKEIIEILKKQDEKEVKKAIDYFESQELHYSHLEKSFNGKWIEKAGYGIGTVRIWKGKKYKKIAPGKWARVFEKEGRGTNIAIGKLIAKVQKIDNVEDLMAFVMANKQRFVDENGVDLPVLDKLRAAVDARNGSVGSKTSGLKLSDKELERLKEQNMTVENLRHKGYTDEEIKEFAKPKASKEEIRNQVINGYKNKSQDEIEKDLAYLRKQIKSDDSMTVSLVGSEKMPIKDAIEILKDIKKNNNTKAALKEVREQYGIEEENSDVTRAKDYIKKYAGKKINSNEIKDINILDDGRRSGFLTFEFKSGNDKYKMTKDFGFGGEKGGVSIKKIESEESENKTYWIQDSRGNRLTNEDAKKRLMADIENLKEYKNEYLLDRLNPEDRKEIESEFEKTKNRSDAMKGNKNAYKGKAEEIANKKLLSKEEMLKKPISKIYQYANADVYGMENFKTIDEALEDSFETYKGSIELGELTEDVLAERVGKEWAKKQNHDIAREIIKDEKEGKLVVNDDGIFVSKKEPEVNNPEALKGIDFVNKNKMHVLANFLANHDKVNMATAVVRLQNAYERLGEEKFLAHFPKDVVERYRKEAGKEETKKESFTPISKDKMKSMSDDELKDYEAKLEKDLLNSNRNDSDYMDKYNHWREVHGENNDRFHQRIEDEARAEKQAETDAKAQKENEIKERYNGYFENRKGLDKARDLKTLEKKYNFDGKVMSSKEFVEQAMDNGVEIKEREVNKLDYPSRTRWNRMNGYEQDEYEKRIKAAGKKTIYSIDGYEFPKTVVDYAKFYKEKKGNVKKSAFDDFVMDMFIDEDEEIEDAIKTDESLFNDYSAEQPELFNSTSMMVREAFNRCRVL